MDEEEGVLGQRRGLIDDSSSSSTRGEQLGSLASAVVVENDPVSERCNDRDANGLDRADDDDDEFGDDDDGEGGERAGFLRPQPPPSRHHRTKRRSLPASSSSSLSPEESSSSSPFSATEQLLCGDWTWTERLLQTTLLPDEGLSIRGHLLIDGRGGGFATKFLKFVASTFVAIAMVHIVVAHLFDDRDRVLRLVHIWKYEADLIVRDCLVFFVVGRLWEKKGIDHWAWVGTALLANVYFESQNFVGFLQHSVTLFQMHCLWPWELWVFALVMVVASAGLVLAHAVWAWRERILFVKLAELGLCILFFIAPMITSQYFHMHHWYAGWLMGMHFNYDVWWSRLAMAWCWGMYVNGIAVYGRDPVLTCEYSYFLTLDNRCPYIACYLDGLADVNNTNVTEMVPVDWRNCSATDDYHP